MSASTTDSLQPETEKHSGRRPEGPAHARKGSAFQTLKRTVAEFSEDNLTDAAAALTYYAVLSIFPALLAMISIVGLIIGLAAGQVAKKIFDKVWGLVRDEEAPRPKHREISIATLVAALLVEGAIARVVRGMVDHGTRHGWAQLTGGWPGEERPEEA